MNYNYYTVLNCTENATFDEIKRNYRQLIKICHPDKQSGLDKSEEFVRIVEAWRTLRDEKLRKEYDSILMELRFKEQNLVYATLDLKELSFDNDLSYYPCRCGHFYVINKSVGNECVIECDECSYVIVVVNK